MGRERREEAWTQTQVLKMTFRIGYSYTVAYQAAVTKNKVILDLPIGKDL